MSSIIDSCFLCTKADNCVPLDNDIVSQVEYLLPEITITKLGIPLRICSVCYEALYAFNKFKQFCMESCRRLEARIKGAQPSGALGPPQTQLPPDRASETIQLHTDTNSNNAEEIVIKTETQEETQNEESCNNILKNILLNKCSSREHNTEGGSAASDTSATSVVKTEMIEEIFIKEEPLEDPPDDMNTYDMLQCTLKEENESNSTELDIETKCAPLNTSEPSHTKPQLIETNFTEEEDLEIQIPETIIIVDNDKDNQSAESVTLHTSEMWEGSSENFGEETETDNQTNYQCGICTKEIKQKWEFDRHMKIHFGIKDFMCEICNKAFSQKGNLTTHMKSHFGKNEFRCEFCNKAFKLKGNLVTHRKTHLGIKDFICQICNKAFAQKTTLANHMKSHTVKQDLYCDICDVIFARKFNFEKHMKTHPRRRNFLEKDKPLTP